VTAPITQTQITVPVDIRAGTAVGTYYPQISITAKTPVNYGGLNVIDPTRITTQYTYTEVLGSVTAGPYLTPFSAPLLSVQ
jgi:energy-converting hydrogenase Eha subunit F